MAGQGHCKLRYEFANTVASVGKEKEDYSHQMFLKYSCSLNLVLAIPALGISRIWRAETFYYL
jgi:hypothetical protein